MVKFSGRTKPKKINPKLRGFFERHKGEFRPSKSNRKMFVEKRRFRLDSSKERGDIKKAKRLKKPFPKRL